MPVSNVIEANGTVYYDCAKCHQATDIKVGDPDFQDREWVLCDDCIAELKED